LQVRYVYYRLDGDTWSDDASFEGPKQWRHSAARAARRHREAHPESGRYAVRWPTQRTAGQIAFPEIYIMLHVAVHCLSKGGFL
jgi:hypothetical protein